MIPLVKYTCPVSSQSNTPITKLMTALSLLFIICKGCKLTGLQVLLKGPTSLANVIKSIETIYKVVLIYSKLIQASNYCVLYIYIYIPVPST